MLPKYPAGPVLPPARDLLLWSRSCRGAPGWRPKAGIDDNLARLEVASSTIATEPGCVDDFVQTNFDWRVAVPMTGHKNLLTGFMLAFSRTISVSTDNRGFVNLDVRRATVKAHRVITYAFNPWTRTPLMVNAILSGGSGLWNP